MASLVTIEAWVPKSIAALAGVIVMAPTIAPYRWVSYAAIAILASGALFAGRATRSVDRPLLGMLVLLVALTAVALFRGAENGVLGTTGSAVTITLQLAALAIFAVRFAMAAPSDDALRSRFHALMAAPGILLAVSLVLYFVGSDLPWITLPAERGLAVGAPATALRWLGFADAIRHQLPMTSGVTAAGTLSAMTIVMSTTLARHSTGLVRSTHVSLVAIAIVAALITDSRTAMFMTVLVLTIGAVTPRLRNARGWALLLPLSPLALLLGLRGLAPTAVSDSLSRQGADFATGTGRTEIWQRIWDSTLSQPSATQLIGYGGNGQVPSGAYAAYSSILDGGTSLPGVVYTAHNVYLQTVLDSGYLGLAVLVGVVALAVSALWSSGVVGRGLSGAVVVAMLCGTTEASPSAYFLDVMAIFVLLIGVAAVAGGSRLVGEASKPRDPALHDS